MSEAPPDCRPVCYRLPVLDNPRIVVDIHHQGLLYAPDAQREEVLAGTL